MSGERETAATIARDVDEMIDAGSGKPVTLNRTSVVDDLLDAPAAKERAGERYRVEKEIAVGGMGRVLLAHDADLCRPVAVKLVRSKSAGARQRFVSEVQLAGQLQHPNIVPVHDVGVADDGTSWYTMSYVEGATLGDIIAQLQAGDPVTHARFTPARRMKLFFDVLDAVGYAHARGVIHCDLKPGNILVGTHGEVFVTDWGIARKKGAPVDERRKGQVIGTPHYMAPEQAHGELDIDERADIYSLSAILFELLSLNHYLRLPPDPSEEQVLAAVKEQRVWLASSRGHRAQSLYVPVDISRTIRRGLHKERSKRFQSIAEMRSAFLRIEDGRPDVVCGSTLLLRGLGGLRNTMSRQPTLGWFAVAGFFACAIYGAGSLAMKLLSLLSL